MSNTRTHSVVNIVMLMVGGGILAFGLYHVHSFSGVSEGGVLGATLLLEHWFSLSPSISSIVLNLLCYWIGFRLLGKRFIFRSLVSSLSFSVVYAVCEFFPPLFQGLDSRPLLAAVLGALFVGVGVGLCVRAGGAPGGDDALAMSLSKRFFLDIRWIYLVSDVLVLALSLSYIPWSKIAYSLLTVLLSGQLVGYIDAVGRKKQ